MTSQYAQLIDADQFVFSVLDVATLTLFKGVLWQSTDLTYATATGSLFHAYEDGSANPVASITLVDVTADISEPNVNAFSQADVAEFDAQIKARIERQSTLVEWTGSSLNETSDIKALVTPYVAMADGQPWQYIAVRTHQNGSHFVVLGAFNLSHSNTLAPQVLQALGSVSFKPAH